MATKSQLKQYFETGKIPTQAQFGELIDYMAPMIDDNNNNNKTIIFDDNTKPFIDGFRIIHTTVVNKKYTYYLFTTTSKNVPANSTIPYFIIRSSVASNGNSEVATEIHILSNLEIRTYFSEGVSALTATDDIILAIIKNYSYVPLINENIPSYCETPTVSVNSIVPGPGTYTLQTNLSGQKMLTKFYITIIDSKWVLYKFERIGYVALGNTRVYNIGLIKSLNDDLIDKLTINPGYNFDALINMINTDNFTIKAQ
nr:MAG: hypothetical protein [Bacteriophage sp.]